LIGSLVIHGILALGAGAFIVAQYIQSPAPKFVAPPAAKLKMPPQTRQHRMNLAAHAGLASRPTFKKRLVSLRPTAFALPEAPKISFKNSLVPDPSTIASTMISGLTGSAGVGNGAGLGLGGSGGLGKGLSNFSFMGVKAQGQRVVLCFDVSSSVVNKATSSGMPLLKIKEETNQLLNNLPSGAQFGLIQFVRNYKPFANTLTPMTPANRDLAMQWIETEWNEGGQMNRGQAGVLSPEPNGVVCVLDAAFAMKPDVIFIISDGQFEQTYPKNQRIPNDVLEAKMKQLLPEKRTKVIVHFIGFQMRREDKTAWERMVRRSGGKLREIR
jgi:hypothetical protein